MKLVFLLPRKTNAAEIFQDRPFGRTYWPAQSSLVGGRDPHKHVCMCVVCVYVCVCVCVCVCVYVVDRVKEDSLGSVKNRKAGKILSHYLLRYKFIQLRVLKPYPK